MSKAMFSVEDARRIAAAVRIVEGTPRRKPGVGMGPGAEPRKGPTSFPALITSSEARLTSSVNLGGQTPGITVELRWKYAWSEAEWTGIAWQAKSGGRSGTLSTGWAQNTVENGNSGNNAWGVNMAGAAYPRGFRPKAVANGAVVEMRVGVGTDGSPFYRFEATGSHDGSCE